MNQALPNDWANPGFTPASSHFPALFELLAEPDEKQAERAEKTLARAGLGAARAAVERLPGTEPPLRARLVRLVGRVARVTDDGALRAALLSLLDDADPKSRRNAIIALGKLGGPGVEDALLARFPASSLPHQRSIAEALGKIGGPRSRALLQGVETSDPELARLAARARTMLARSELRAAEATTLDLGAPLPGPSRFVARCRAGLAEVLLEEASERRLGVARVTRPDRVEIESSGSLADLGVLRTALDLSLAFPLSDASDQAIVERLTSDEVLARMRAVTRGPLRFRLDFGSGHRRARVFRIAELLTARGAPLVNDPRDAPWEARIDEREHLLLLWPRAARDDRFAYRARDVPAASHPTIAAALARVAGVCPEDVVWDPFVGSGLELVERGLLGPYRELIGSDVDPRALEAARENLSRAGLARFRLLAADVRSPPPTGISLIVTNPPMGRRVARDGSLGKLVDATAESAARALGQGGRMVWLSPLGEQSARALGARGFEVERRGAIDLGGFDAELQVARRPARRQESR